MQKEPDLRVLVLLSSLSTANCHLHATCHKKNKPKGEHKTTTQYYQEERRRWKCYRPWHRCFQKVEVEGRILWALNIWSLSRTPIVPSTPKRSPSRLKIVLATWRSFPFALLMLIQGSRLRLQSKFDLHAESCCVSCCASLIMYLTLILIVSRT